MRTIILNKQFDHLKLLVDKNYEHSVTKAPDLLARHATQAKIDKWATKARLAEELLVATC